MFGDAIGNDILGAYNLLTKMGFDCWIIGEWMHEKVLSCYQTDDNLDSLHINEKYDLLIYHHSIYWEEGGQFLATYKKQIVVKFHNITPPNFFSPYFQPYAEACQNGINQIHSLKKNPDVILWQADSAFNLNDLVNNGVKGDIIKIVAPFNRTDQLRKMKNQAQYDKNPTQLLFIGRRAPNKGHSNLLRMLAKYCALFSEQIILNIVGMSDHALKAYNEEIDNLIIQLELTEKIVVMPHISDKNLDDLFLNSHVYINLSEHEGFCVPVIEAQAIGLPVITTEACALRETMGLNQAVFPHPTVEEDFELYAGAIHEIITNKPFREKLVINGLRNVRERFSQEVLENLFISSIEPVLRRLV